MKNEVESRIIEVLSKNKIKNQRSLGRHLQDHGIRVDQSTLSRHLKALGIEKKDGYYHLLNKKENGHLITPVTPNLIVIKTQLGHAPALAYHLDNKKENEFKGIVGTLAGEDTVLCIVESPRILKALCNQLGAFDLSK